MTRRRSRPLDLAGARWVSQQTTIRETYALIDLTDAAFRREVIASVAPKSLMLAALDAKIDGIRGELIGGEAGSSRKAIARAREREAWLAVAAAEQRRALRGRGR